MSERERVRVLMQELEVKTKQKTKYTIHSDEESSKTHTIHTQWFIQEERPRISFPKVTSPHWFFCQVMKVMILQFGKRSFGGG